MYRVDADGDSVPWVSLALVVPLPERSHECVVPQSTPPFGQVNSGVDLTGACVHTRTKSGGATYRVDADGDSVGVPQRVFIFNISTSNSKR
jgi:hypothetical protein